MAQQEKIDDHMEGYFTIAYLPVKYAYDVQYCRAIELISEIIKKEIDMQLDVIVKNQTSYRFAWRDLETGHVNKGTFLFNEPAEAHDTNIALKATFPNCEIWLEDRQGQRVEIPK